jgi:predicted  nucleic acid-binding Zn-ribbon protein
MLEQQQLELYMDFNMHTEHNDSAVASLKLVQSDMLAHNETLKGVYDKITELRKEIKRTSSRLENELDDLPTPDNDTTDEQRDDLEKANGTLSTAVDELDHANSKLSDALELIDESMVHLRDL